MSVHNQSMALATGGYAVVPIVFEGNQNFVEGIEATVEEVEEIVAEVEIEEFV